jgi:hypothetical protein
MTCIKNLKILIYKLLELPELKIKKFHYQKVRVSNYLAVCLQCALHYPRDSEKNLNTCKSSSPIAHGLFFESFSSARILMLISFVAHNHERLTESCTHTKWRRQTLSEKEWSVSHSESRSVSLWTSFESVRFRIEFLCNILFFSLFNWGIIGS